MLNHIVAPKLKYLICFFGLGQGANVVFDMIEKVGLKPGQYAIFDNYFGSVKLLDELASKRIAATCTL